MLLRPLGARVQNVSSGLWLRQQSPVFSCCCRSAPGLVEGRAQGPLMEKSFRFQKDFFFLFFFPFLPNWIWANTNTTPGCVCALCVLVCSYYSVRNRSWTAHKAPSVCVLLVCRSPVESRMLCSDHHLIPQESVWKHSKALRVCVCVCVSKHVCLCVHCIMCIWVEKSHIGPLCHCSQTQFVPYVPCYSVSTHSAPRTACSLKHQHNVSPSRGETEPRQGIPPQGMMQGRL